MTLRYATGVMKGSPLTDGYTIVKWRGETVARWPNGAMARFIVDMEEKKSTAPAPRLENPGTWTGGTAKMPPPAVGYDYEPSNHSKLSGVLSEEPEASIVWDDPPMEKNRSALDTCLLVLTCPVRLLVITIILASTLPVVPWQRKRIWNDIVVRLWKGTF